MALVAAVSFTGIFDFGFTQTVARFAGEHRARRDAGSVNAFIAATGVAYLVAFVLVLLAAVTIGIAFPWIIKVPEADRAIVLPGAMLVGVATAAGLWMGFLSSILHAFQRLPVANAVRTGYWALFMILTIGAVIAGWGIIGLAAAMAVSAILSCITCLVLVQRVIPELRIQRPQRRYLGKAMRYSLFMFLISVGVVVVFETDTLVIAAFVGAAAVTSYAIALRLTRGLTLFVHKIADVLFPFYAGMRATGEQQRMAENFLLTSRLEVVGGTIVVLALAFAGRPLIGVWVGSANVAGVGVVSLALLLIFTEAVIHPAAVLASAAGGERRMALVNNVEAALNLGLSILLVLRFGVVGVIAGTVLAQAATNLWFLPRWAVRHLGLSTADYLRQTFGATVIAGSCGALAGAVVMALRFPFVAAAVSVAVFSLVYLKVGASPREQDWLRQLVRSGDRAA